jgi:nicotinamidase/pyrazinamidase
MTETRQAHGALLVVDVQRDFCPGGALAAPTGDQILPALNQHIVEARKRGVPVYASRDWHPAVTTHFKPYGGEWPPHCVQGTEGAQFHQALQLPPDTIVISKGDRSDEAGYSAFEGRTPTGQPLLDDLRERHIDTVYVAGLTAEYCVKQTALDAVKAGLDVVVLKNAVGGLDMQPGDADRALAEMKAAGAVIATEMVDTKTRRHENTKNA